MNSKAGFPMRWAILSGEPVMKLSMPTTSSPSARNRSQRCEPRNPAAPVIRIRMLDSAVRGSLHGPGSGRRGPPHRHVLESQFAHAFRFPEIAAVEDDRLPEE